MFQHFLFLLGGDTTPTPSMVSSVFIHTKYMLIQSTIHLNRSAKIKFSHFC